MTTDAGEAIAADGMEAMRQAAVAGVTECVCAVAQQTGAVTVMTNMATRALLRHLRGVLGRGKTGDLGGVTLAAKLCGRALEQTHKGAVVR